VTDRSSLRGRSPNETSTAYGATEVAPFQNRALSKKAGTSFSANFTSHFLQASSLARTGKDAVLSPENAFEYAASAISGKYCEYR
jgi:hypothetical protein